MNQAQAMRITPKIYNANGYAKYGWTGLPQPVEKKEPVKTTKKRHGRSYSEQEKRKMMRGIRALLRNENVVGRFDAYEILKDRGFLPAVAQFQIMSYSRFMDYYCRARKSLGITPLTGTKKEYILANYKTMLPSEIAKHIEAKAIYVNYIIAKFKRTGK